MDLNDADIPDNADKLLFAEDFVSYIMTDIFHRPYEGTWATPYRPFIHNAFNENMKLVLCDLINRSRVVKSSYYSMIEDIREPNDLSYWEVVQDLQNRFSSEGFDAKLFLLYSIDVTITALIFKDNGLDSAPDIAVSAIFEFLKDYDMLSTGWSTLNILVSSVARIHVDRAGILTPDSLSPSSTESGHDQDMPNISGLQGKDSVLQSKEDAKTEAGEDLTGIQINMSESKGAFSANENTCTENLESSCLSTSKHLLLRSDIQKVAQYEMKCTKENPVTRSKGDLFVTEGIEAEYLQTPSVSEESNILRTLNTIQADTEKTATTVSDSNSKVDIDTVDEKGISISYEKIDIDQKHLVLKEDNVQLLETFDEHEKSVLSEDSCLLVMPKKSSGSRESTHLPGPSSESYLQDDKGRNRSKSCPTDLNVTSTKKSAGEKRSSHLCSKQNNDKKLKQ